MSKFKVGDRVSDLYPAASAIGTNAGTIRERDPSGESWRIDWDGTTLFKDCWADDQIRLIDQPDEPALPVRTVTRTVTVTEIVPGIYGSIMVSEPGDYAVFIRMHIEDHGKFMDAAQLRAAGRLFVSLAEALEETT